MAIQDKISKAIDYFSRNEISDALEQSMIAADATAKKIYKIRNNKERMEKFFQEKMIIITGIGLQMLVSNNLSLGFGDGSESESFETILYKYIRCSLLHESDVAPNVSFSPNTLSCVGGQFIFPNTLPLGICFAVISSSENKTLWMRNPKFINFKGKPINLNQFWGSSPELVGNVVLG